LPPASVRRRVMQAISFGATLRPVPLRSKAPRQTSFSRAPARRHVLLIGKFEIGVTLLAGSGSWSNLSDRNAKSAIVPVSDDDILAKVSSLPISEWSYTTERGVRHVGPMAQDFYAAFNVGEDDRHITSIDEDGVALAAIKALNARVERRDALLDAKLAAKDARIDALQRQMANLAIEVSALRRTRR